MNQPTNEKDLQNQSFLEKNIARRKFFAWAGTTAIGTLIFQASCKKEATDPSSNLDTIDLGKDDLGVMNYLFAFEQVSTYFFQRALSALTDKITGTERELW